MKTRPLLTPVLVVSVMLLAAVASLPYGYYEFLIWAVTSVPVFIAITAYSGKHM